MNKPQYVKVNNKLYKINTDFRIALECNKIAEDGSIGDYERCLAILYKLFGEEGLKCEDQNKLIELAISYLLMGNEEKELKTQPRGKYELDFSKCEWLIKSSFKFDYKYDPYELEYLHFYDFYNDLQNLSTSEFGNCCILNRVQNILETDPSTIKDTNEQRKIVEAQRMLIKKYCKTQKKSMTKEEKENVMKLYKELGITEGGT